MRKRAGFTLWEIATVLLIMSITATVAAPAFVRLGADKTQTTTDLYLKLLHDVRALAVGHAVQATLVIDPTTGHYRVDSASAFGSGKVAEDTLRLGAIERLQTDLPRLQYIFRATGAAFADSVLITGGDSIRLVIVDPWSGVAYAKAR